MLTGQSQMRAEGIVVCEFLNFLAGRAIQTVDIDHRLIPSDEIRFAAAFKQANIGH